jgi:hypothetical protein
VVLMQIFAFHIKDKPDPEGHTYYFEGLEDPLEWDKIIMQWCAEQFGLQDQVMASRWFGTGGDYWFRDMEDAFAFRMRWC